MANLDFLDAKSDVFTKNDAAWAREERRFFGGDAVLDELVQWHNESAAKLLLRRGQAPWLGLPKEHAQTVSGHIVSQMPIPNYGTMGDVRERQEIAGAPSVAELFHYNCDGMGNDGTQLPAYTSGVIQRALATGHRYTLVEMPKVAEENMDRPITQADVLSGHRPYLVEYSPRSVPIAEYTNGRLDWAVIRTKVGTPLVDGVWQPGQTALGYYLLVRQGFAGLGDQFAGGGWWIYDSDKNLKDQGTWERTRGQIPLARLVSESSSGIQDWPAVSRLALMEIGQITAALMNRISERDWNASDSARSTRYIMGGDKNAHNLVVDMHLDNAAIVTVPGAVDPTGGFTVPSLVFSSAGAVESNVFQIIIDSHLTFARELMVRHVTSTPDSSGESKRAGFGEATSPMLANLAANVETWLNTIIYFAELRSGGTTPRGFVVLPREFELAPIMQKIDRNLERMQKAAARSATLEATMIEAAARDDGLWPKAEADGKKAKDELVASLTQAQRLTQSTIIDTMAKTFDGEASAKFAGVEGAVARALVQGEREEVEPTTNGNGAVPPTNGTAPLPPRQPLTQ